MSTYTIGDTLYTVRIDGNLVPSMRTAKVIGKNRAWVTIKTEDGDTERFQGQSYWAMSKGEGITKLIHWLGISLAGNQYSVAFFSDLTLREKVDLLSRLSDMLEAEGA